MKITFCKPSIDNNEISLVAYVLKQNKLLGYKPRYSLKDGAREYIRFLNKN